MRVSVKIDWRQFALAALALALLGEAAAESGRRMILRAVTGQPSDHPEVLTIPETGYLKGALVEAGE